MQLMQGVRLFRLFAVMQPGYKIGAVILKSYLQIQLRKFVVLLALV